MESEIYWLQQTEADVPPGDDWLSGGERAILEGLRYAKRRADWRLGRWSAKCAAAAYLKSSIPPTCLAEIEVYALPSGAPQVVLPNGLAPVAISLSHRNSIGMCAIGRPDTAIGCDLEIVEAHSTAFMRDYFTEEEEWEIAQAPAGSRQTFVAVLWSAKESTLKALQEGLRLDTRSVSVRLGSRADEISDWHPLQVRCQRGELFHGWWQQTGNVVRTLVARPTPGMPMLLAMAGIEILRSEPRAAGGVHRT